MIQTMITKNERLKRCNDIMWVVLVVITLVAGFSTYKAIHFYKKYSSLFDASTEFNSCCAKYKCTGVYVSKRICISSLE